MGTMKDYLQPSPIEKYFAHRDMWEKIFSMNERVLKQNLMMDLKPLQIAMQPYLESMTIAQSANNAIIANMPSIDRIANGFDQLEQIHKIMQPMAEYHSVLENLEHAFSDVSFPKLAVSSEELPPLEELPALESRMTLLPGERRLVEVFIKDEKPLNWFQAHFPKLSKVTVEDAYIFIFLLILYNFVVPSIRDAIKG